MKVKWEDAHLVSQLHKFLDARCRAIDPGLTCRIVPRAGVIELRFTSGRYERKDSFLWDHFVAASDRYSFIAAIVRRAEHELRMVPRVTEQIASCRQQGTTTALIGLAITTNGTLVVRSGYAAAELRKRFPQARVVSMNDELRGVAGPLYYDTDVVGLLAEKAEL